MNRIFITSILAILPIWGFAQNGPDIVRAGMFKAYAISASHALAAQDAMLTINLGDHIMSKEVVDKTTNFQRQFNNYLKNFDNILTMAAEIYGIYYEVTQATKNIKELQSFVVKCPANTLAVAFSKSKNGIYKDVIDNGIQIAADVKKLIPIGKDDESNTKMTEYERINCIGKIRKTLQGMNKKIRKMNRLLHYTTLLDSWYELRGTYHKPRSMYTICADCQKRWASKARLIKY